MVAMRHLLAVNIRHLRALLKAEMEIWLFAPIRRRLLTY
jgi:hypothetical protein